jgi:hypothetical protein
MRIIGQLVILLLTVPIAAAQSNPPVSAVLSVDPGYNPDHAWTLSIQTNGNATFTRMFSKGTNTLLTFSVEQMSRLSALAASNGFFWSSNVFGDNILDASTRKITIASATKSNTVEILGLHNWTYHERLPEVVPSLQVWDEVESWINEDRIIRFREQDKKLIKNAQPLQPTSPGDSSPRGAGLGTPDK